MKLIFATANAHKCQEAHAILGPHTSIIMPMQLGFAHEIPETGLTLQENALQKAQYIWDLFKQPCFADDTGLEVEALHGAPGVHSARFAGEHCPFADNIKKLLTLMEGETNRKACFKCVIALILDGTPYFFEGRVDGILTTSLQEGEQGFGYDPLFVPDGYEKTFAQLPAGVKNAISHRGKALEKMATFLQEKR